MTRPHATPRRRPGRRRRSPCRLGPAAVRGGGYLAAVPVDLLAEVVVLSLQEGDALLHLLVVLGQQAEALGHRGLPAAGQVRVPAHLRDGHAGLAQAPQYTQPLHVVVAEAAVPTWCAVDVVQQADPLVVPQRVEAEAGLLGGLAGREDALHAQEHDTWSGLQVKGSRAARSDRRPRAGAVLPYA